MSIGFWLSNVKLAAIGIGDNSLQTRVCWLACSEGWWPPVAVVTCNTYQANSCNEFVVTTAPYAVD